jgi:hypothetical protein
MPIPSKPALYRLSRLVRLLSTLAVVGIVVYVAFAAYSAVVYHPNGSTPSGNSSTTTFSSGSAIETTSIQLSNPGYFSLSSLTLDSTVRFANGTFLSTASSPPVTIGPHSNATIPITLIVPLSGASVSLLTRDAQLNVTTQLSAVYASLFSLQVGIVNNFSWGAPFNGLSVKTGAPFVDPNGTTEIPVSANWTNDASISESGTLTITVVTAAGTLCGSGSAPVNVPSKSAGLVSTNVSSSSGCNPSGGQVELTFTGPGLSFTLPPQRIP